MFDFFKKKTIEEKMDIIKTSYEKQQESMVESKSPDEKYIWVEGFKGTQENMCCTVTYPKMCGFIAGIVNKYKNMFGKSRIVVVKSQLGQPITAYSGDEVYWEIPDDLPKMTKLMIDGKALYIHRANFQIIDKALLD